MTAPRPPATVSLDLDNQWAYMRVHGDAGWAEFPSYFDLAVPRILDVLARRRLRITVFVVGQDAALPGNRDALAQISAAGHEIANHSFHHQPSLAHQPIDDIDAEIARAEDAIEHATGVRPRGFRGPGFSVSTDLLRVLKRRGYAYDASTFPTFLGPLARAYYNATLTAPAGGEADRATLYGQWKDGFRRLKPYRWPLPEGPLLEIPVTTFPVLRVPFHLTYIHYLHTRSRRLALTYFRAALATCRMLGVAPSVLLHPLDFLGGDDAPALGFFPGMNLRGLEKTALVADALDLVAAHSSPITMAEFAVVSSAPFETPHQS